jgi:catechol 2,3-dioxygenase-like lactoylglutathione lyase family enzyme
MTRVVTFLLTAEPEAALAFYRDTLGLTFVRDDGFALVFDMHGVMLRIAKAPEFTPAQHTVLGWEVEDILVAQEGLLHKGIAFEHYPNMGQDEHGICTFPNGDKVAWFKDPDGNLLSISQHMR